MEIQDILGKVDHTLLRVDSTWEQIKEICDDGIKYGTASVCIPASFVKQAKEYVGGRVAVCTVVGFPNGYSTTASKVFETKDAVKNGADEIDMVINVGNLKDKKYDLILNEIKEIKAACGGRVLKVIIETCYLTQDEIVRACQAAAEAKANFVKTSTGFGTGGAKPEDVALMKKSIPSDMCVKASGGIHNYQEALSMVEAGASRIGASAGIQIVSEAED